ncbi:MAG: hypothetical protein MUE85_05060 [Microscillaceae bacterium]|jgi:hypothetical protein|nr:hypothetical protein [Microscillaceae bacterium]
MENLPTKISQLTNTLLAVLKVAGGEANADDFPQLADYEAISRNPKFIQQRQSLIAFYRQNFNPSAKLLTINQLIIQHLILTEVFRGFSFFKQNPLAQPLQDLLDVLVSKKLKNRLLSDLQLDLAELSQQIKNEDFTSQDWEKFKSICLSPFYPKAAKTDALSRLPTLAWQWLAEFLKNQLKNHHAKNLAETALLASNLDSFTLQLFDYQSLNENSKIALAQLPDYYWLAYRQAKNQQKSTLLFAHAPHFFATNQTQTSLFASPNPFLNLWQDYSSQKFPLVYINTQSTTGVMNPLPIYWQQRAKAIYNLNGEDLDKWATWRWASEQLSEGGLLLSLSDNQWLRSEAMYDFRQKISAEFAQIILLELPDNQLISFFFKTQTPDLEAKATIRYCKIENNDFWLKNIEQSLDYQILSSESGDWFATPATNSDILLPLIATEVKSGRSKKAVFKWFENFKVPDYQPLNQNQLLPLGGEIPDTSQLFIANYAQSTDFFVWAGEGQLEYKFLKKTLVVPYYRQAGDGQIVENISQWGLNQFKKYYETEWQNQAQSNVYWLKKLFDFSDFEQCQVEESLAFEIRRLTLLADDSREINQLFKTIQQPEAKTEEILNKFQKIFREVARTYTRLGNRAGKNAESRDILKRYFEEGEEALHELQLYLDKMHSGIMLEHSLQAEISKKDIFYYVYAVLQSPDYQQKYAENLKNRLPELPLYSNFWHWVEWGKKLFTLHSQFEKIKALELNALEQAEEGVAEKWLWKVDIENRQIALTNYLKIQKLPQELWELTVQNRPLVDWFLESFKNQIKTKTLIDNDLLIQKKAYIHTLAKITWLAQETLRIRREMSV